MPCAQTMADALQKVPAGFITLDLVKIRTRCQTMRKMLLIRVTVSDGHDKPFCTKAITIIDNFKKVLGDTDNGQISIF